MGLTNAGRQRKHVARQKLIERHGRGPDSNDVLITVNENGTCRVWWFDGKRWTLSGIVVTNVDDIAAARRRKAETGTVEPD